MNPWKDQESRSLVEATLLVVGLAMIFWLVSYHVTVTRFFHIGEIVSTPPELASAFVYRGQNGYDGQYYLVLGLDPLLLRQASIEALDNSLYRSRRILYPASGFFLAGGHPNLLPFALIGLNLAAFIFLVWTAESLWGRQSLYSSEGLLPLSLTGAWISLLFGTAELVEVALLAGAMLAYRRTRYGLVGGLLALALLCRETSLLVFVGFLIAGVSKKQKVLLAHLAWAWLPAGVWNLIIWNRFGSLGGFLGRENVGWPFVGLVEAVFAQDQNMTRLNQAYELASLLILVVVASTFVWHAREISEIHAPLALGGMCYALLLCFAGRSVLEYHLGFHRVFLPLYLFCLIGLMACGRILLAQCLFAGHGVMTAVWLLHLSLKEFQVG